MSDAIQLLVVSGAAVVALVALTRPVWRRRAAPAQGGACAKCAAGPKTTAQPPGEPLRPR